MLKRGWPAVPSWVFVSEAGAPLAPGALHAGLHVGVPS
jgi:hypothetical protein